MTAFNICILDILTLSYTYGYFICILYKYIYGLQVIILNVISLTVFYGLFIWKRSCKFSKNRALEL